MLTLLAFYENSGIMVKGINDLTEDIMLLLQKDSPVLNISENGSCQILDFDRLPFALRREGVTFP